MENEIIQLNQMFSFATANLERSNVTMRRQFSLVNSWLENGKELKETHEKEMDELKRVNSKVFLSLSLSLNQTNLETTVNFVLQLIDENKELKHQLDELRSVKNATIDDTVVIAANEADNEAQKRCAQLEARVQNLQIELSNAIAEKLENDDMKKTYIDEIDCVQVNLVATEELFKVAKAETMELKAENATLKQDVKKLENTSAAQLEELNVIKAQVNIIYFSCSIDGSIHDIFVVVGTHQLEVYKTDFELERAARQEIAGQKEQLSADLQLLQQRNQMLIEASAEGATAVAAPAPQEQ